MWKVKYYAIALTALAVKSDRLWEKAWAYGYKKTHGGQEPSQGLLDEVFGRS